MNAVIEQAAPGQVRYLVHSVAALFAEDGGCRDRFLDTNWPHRDGAAYYADLVADGRCLCLLAWPDQDHRPTPIGHLIGRIQSGNPLRPQATVGILESMRVDDRHRRTGVGTALVATFFDWARRRGANEASVTAYSANVIALGFYRHHGFAPFETTLHAPL